MVPSGRAGSGHQFVADDVNALVVRARDGDPIIGDHIPQGRFCVRFDVMYELSVVATDLLGHVLRTAPG